MQSICLKGDLHATSLARIAMSRHFELRSDATFAIVFPLKVCSILRIHLRGVQLKDRKDRYLPQSLYLGNVLIVKVQNVYNNWRGSALCDYDALE